MTNGNDLIQAGRITDTNQNVVELGLTKREYFAAMAMQGICADQTYLRPNEAEEIAIRAVGLADALITQLNKPTTND